MIKGLSLVKVAENAGFCFGVKRAVDMVYSSLETANVCVLGELIHNADVLNELENKGVRTIYDIDDVSPDEILIIRSHGVTEDIYKKLETRRRENFYEYRDATCPFVKKIHKIVKVESEKGNFNVIVGDKKHPEIIGIASFCSENHQICRDCEEIETFLRKKDENFKKTLAFSFQTTYNIVEWKKCIRFIESHFSQIPKEHGDLNRKSILGEPFALDGKNENTLFIIHDTICKATSENQRNGAKLAVQVAENNGVMLVVGSKNSSNTDKLFKICEEKCANTFKIENALSIPQEVHELAEKSAQNFFKKGTRLSPLKPLVGITAGASAPHHIIQEVLSVMSDAINNFSNDEEFNFEEALKQSLKRIHTGEKVKGVVAEINNREIIVDLGIKQTGYIPLSELGELEETLNVGDTIDAVAVKINDSEGTVSLSRKKLDESGGFESLIKAKTDGSVLSGIVTNVVSGGLLAVTQGQRVFIPLSHSGLAKDADPGVMLKKKVDFKILDVNEQRRRAVGSIRNAGGRTRNSAAAEKFLDSFNVGDVIKGKVKSFTSYAAFIDLGGADGLVHISELSWRRISHPSEILSIGDEIEVYVRTADKEKHKISLGYRKAKDNPWWNFSEKYHVGDIVDAKIISIAKFGAFARIIDGVDGLIHVSQISDKRIANITDVLKIGDSVKVKIIAVELGSKRINLSIKGASAPEPNVAKIDTVKETVEAK